MSFASRDFLILVSFLFVTYFFLGRIKSRYQWITLLAASFIYYFSAVKLLTVYLIFTAAVSWIGSKSIQAVEDSFDNKTIILRNSESYREEKKQLRRQTEIQKKLILIVTVILLLGILILVKCRSFFFPSFIADKYGWLIMPLGMSFFVFLNILR